MDYISQMFRDHFYGNHMTLPQKEINLEEAEKKCFFCKTYFPESELSEINYQSELVKICPICERKLKVCAYCDEKIKEDDIFVHDKKTDKYYHKDCFE